jgi:acid phosphatase (class B)
MKSIILLSWLAAAAQAMAGHAAISGNTASNNNTARRYICEDTNDGRSVHLNIHKNENTFEVTANTKEVVLFKRNAQRPSLNVRAVEASSSSNHNADDEFIAFNDAGLDVIPIGGTNKLEIDLSEPVNFVHYRDADKELKLKCTIASERLVSFLGIRPRQRVTFKDAKAVAFDVDDTLMFTSPTFTRGFAAGGTPKPDDTLFWTYTNNCDGGCSETIITLPDGNVKTLPANAPSTPKAKALEVIRYHQNRGHKVYAITARPDINGEPLREYIETAIGIARENVFFEPDIDQPGNAAGKTDRIESLDLDVFYGDSDTDITDTNKAFSNGTTRTKKVQAVRFLRSPKSSNRKAGELNKYHPGYFGEPILADSY